LSLAWRRCCSYGSAGVGERGGLSTGCRRWRRASGQSRCCLCRYGNDAESEFLRYALADEIANALTYAHSLEVRPSASTQKYGNETDPAKAGRELGVGTVVTGHFLRQDKMVMVTLEAVEVKDNKLIWTGTLKSPADNLIALQNQMAKKVRQELVPALGAAKAPWKTAALRPIPKAYDAVFAKQSHGARWGRK
jgi:TolB-like protein